MYSIFFFILLIGYFITAGICIYTTISISMHKEKYKTNLNVILIISTLINAGVIYSGLYVFSIIYYYSDVINTLLWKGSIISGFFSLALTSIIYSFLKSYKKVPLAFGLFYLTLFGFLFGILMAESSILITYNPTENSTHFILDPSFINYEFEILSEFVIAILQISVVIYFLYISIFIYRNSRKKQITSVFIANTMFFCLPILMYILYAFIPSAIFRELHIILLWLDIVGVCYVALKHSDLFIVLTNHVYYLNIYHKSGVLLYSYEFEKGMEKTDKDSAIWGNILIGINHILSEFIDKNDQIDVLQTKNSDIVVNYNNQCGFAVLVITNKKNEILGNLIKDFTKVFMAKYNKELTDIQDLNRMISVSDFGETKEIIENIFSMYL